MLVPKPHTLHIVEDFFRRFTAVARVHGSLFPALLRIVPAERWPVTLRPRQKGRLGHRRHFLLGLEDGTQFQGPHRDPILDRGIAIAARPERSAPSCTNRLGGGVRRR